MVTASHNPHTDNGLKVFSQFGSKLSIEEEQIIETCIEPTDKPLIRMVSSEVHRSGRPYLENLLTQGFLQISYGE